jgi:hypothetical protein
MQGFFNILDYLLQPIIKVLQFGMCFPQNLVNWVISGERWMISGCLLLLSCG